MILGCGMTGTSISLYLVRMISVLFPQSDILKRFHVASVTTSPCEKKTTGVFYFRISLSNTISEQSNRKTHINEKYKLARQYATISMNIEYDDFIHQCVGILT